MLTLSGIKAAKPQPKPYRLPDFAGLFLMIQPSGSKLWRWRYLRPGTRKENMLSFRSFPTVTLQEAREQRKDARRLLSRGIDPGLDKKVAPPEPSTAFVRRARSSRWRAGWRRSAIMRQRGCCDCWGRCRSYTRPTKSPAMRGFVCDLASVAGYSESSIISVMIVL